MMVMMKEDSDEDVSFLLADDSSNIPFSVEDLSESVKQVGVYNIEPPQLLRQNSGFGFLLPRGEDSPS
ncbi:Myosin-17 [Cardamine amara subsp. amara]|uniref:Myosin-17 n=1 Tax=Cardamine amara subsp. amara TaxID=228776 RepID=A0ABD0ZP18_CARAN